MSSVLYVLDEDPLSEIVMEWIGSRINLFKEKNQSVHVIVNSPPINEGMFPRLETANAVVVGKESIINYLNYSLQTGGDSNIGSILKESDYTNETIEERYNSNSEFLKNYQPTFPPPKQPLGEKKNAEIIIPQHPSQRKKDLPNLSAAANPQIPNPTTSAAAETTFAAGSSMEGHPFSNQDLDPINWRGGRSMLN